MPLVLLRKPPCALSLMDDMRHQAQIVLNQPGAGGNVPCFAGRYTGELLLAAERLGEGSGAGNMQDQKEKIR